MGRTRKAKCGPLHADRFFVLRSLYLGLLLLPNIGGSLFGKSTPCTKELTNANADLDNILTKEEFYAAWASLANHWCLETTIAVDDALFDDMCCSCMEYDVGQFDAWCCMKVTFADSWVGIRMPDDLYPVEYEKSLCDRIENRMREFHCTGNVSLPPETLPPSDSTQPAVSPMPSAGEDQTTTLQQSDSGFMNKLGEGMILALCTLLLMLLLGGIYVWMSSRHSNGHDGDESRESVTKSAQTVSARAVPTSESESLDTLVIDNFSKCNPSEENYFPEKAASPRRSRVEGLNDTPDNSGGILHGGTHEELSTGSQEEPRFFL